MESTAVSPTRFFEQHGAAHQTVVAQSLDELAEPVARVAAALVEALDTGGTVLAFGNGGSAAQASHFAGELLGRFAASRRPLAALALPADGGAVTCIGNDFGFDALFARQLQALARPGDVAVGFTTSGRSQNVLNGLAEAQRQGATTVALTGRAGLGDGATVDHLISVPSDDTALVQEIHLLLVHTWCRWIDHAFPPDD